MTAPRGDFGCCESCRRVLGERLSAALVCYWTECDRYLATVRVREDADPGVLALEDAP